MKKRENNSVHEEVNNAAESGEENEISSNNEPALPDSEKEEQDPGSKLETELTTAKDKYLRLYSDFENYKKRVARERMELAKMAGSDILLSILPVMDDMERAIKVVEEGKSPEAMKEGLVLIYNKLRSSMEAKGLKAMESIGKPFDADLHDAITSVPAGNDMKGNVVDEVEKGYYLNDKVVRHAKVIVGS